MNTITIADFSGKHRLSAKPVFSRRLTRPLALLLMLYGSVAAHAQVGLLWGVSSAADSGPGSLRQAIAAAAQYQNGYQNFIFFTFSGPTTIVLNSPLVISSANMVIDGNYGGGVRYPVTLSANGSGRVLQNQSGSNLEIDSLTIADGSVASWDEGAGVLNYGSLTLKGVTLTRNTGGYGAALSNHGGVTVINSTISGNNATTDSILYEAGSFNYSHCTIAGNTGGPRALNMIGGNGQLYNNIIGTNQGNAVVWNVLNLLSYSGQNNLIEGGQYLPPLFTGTISANPGLGPLSNHGGYTMTMAVLPGSLAINNAATLSGITADQRGIARPQGNAPDIGAFEGRFAHPTFSVGNIDKNTIDPHFDLAGASGPNPSGGVFSGAYVTSGQFWTASASLGANTVTYTATDPDGLSGSNTLTVTMHSTPAPTFTVSNLDRLATSAAFALATASGASPAGGVFSGPGVSNGQFNPAGAPLGVNTITYTLSNPDDPNVYVRATFTITVREVPSLVVTIANDTVSAFDGQTSLREALAYAASLGGSQTVSFAAALSSGGPATLTLGGSELSAAGNVILTGPGANQMTISANSASRVFHVNPGASLRVNGLTLANGKIDVAGGAGAGIYNEGSLTLSNCVLSGHIAGGANGCSGGAVYHHGASLLLQNCLLSGNQTMGGGFGAALGADSGTVGITACTFSGNIANGNGNGGGIANFSAAVGVTNCTFAGNSAENGGALIHYGNVMTLCQCTIVSNTAGFSGGGIERVGRSGNDLRLLGNLIARNSATASGPDAASYNDVNNGSFTSLGHNLIGNGDGSLGLSNGANGDLVGSGASPLDPKVGPLQNNGGSTPTMALLSGASPAFNASVAIPGVATDQRGIARPQFGSPDIGAFELNSPPSSLVVTTLADEDNGNSDPTFGTGTSLREAVAYANTLVGPHTITFAAGLAGQTISLTNFDAGLDADGFGPTALRITNNVVISGPVGASGITLQRSANANFRLFYVYNSASPGDARLRLENLTVSNGVAQGFSGAGGSAGMGGAIFNRRGTVEIVGCTLTGNYALGGYGQGSGGGGGVGAAGAFGNGGGPNGGTQNINGVASDGGFGGGAGAGASGRFGGFGGFGGGGGYGYAGSQGFIHNAGYGGFGGGAAWPASGGAGLSYSVFGGGGGHFVLGAGGGAGMGGAIFNESGAVAVTNSTIVANFATGGSTSGYQWGEGMGGAIFTRNGAVAVTYSTLVGNRAYNGLIHAGDPGPRAGALFAVADAGNGNGYASGNCAVTLLNTILGGNTGAPSDFDSATLGAATITFSGSNNLIQNNAPGASGFTGGIVAAGDPRVGPLANHGGPTATCALLPGSPALFAAASISGLTTDQRGIARPQGVNPDIGAFESRLAATPTFAVTNLNRMITDPAFDLASTSGASPVGGVFSGTGVTNGLFYPAAVGAGQYTITYTITSQDGIPASAGFTVTVEGQPPAITSQPASLALYSGRTASFTVTASGTSLHYQWRANGVPVSDSSNRSGSTTPSLTMTSVSSANIASYDVVITNAAGSITSVVATLSVITPTPGSYEAAVVAANPYAYYRLNETNDPSTGTAPALDFWGGHNGIYGNGAQNGFNGIAGPRPPNFVGFESNNFALRTTANTVSSFATAPMGSLGTNTVTFTAWLYPIGSQANYAGLLVNRGGGASGGFNYNDQQMLGYTWNNNSSATWGFASGLVIPSNQWSFVAVAISPTNAILYLINASGLASATNAIAHTSDVFDNNWQIGHDGDANSSTRVFNGVIDEVALYLQTLGSQQLVQLATIGQEPPAITAQSGSLALYAGRSAAFTVSASGTSLHYQWRSNGVPLGDSGNRSGSTTPSLTMINVSSANAASYDVVITNLVGSVTSVVATLSVITPTPGSYEAAVLAANPFAYYRFNETTDPTSGTAPAWDFCGGHNGLYGNSAQNGFNGIAGPRPPNFIGFESNNFALRTTANTVSSFATAPMGSLGTNTVTFTAWLYPIGSQANYAGLLVNRGGGASGGFNYNDQQMLGYTWNNNSSATWGFASGLVIPSNQWSFVAVAISPTNAILYLINANGLVSATNAIAHTSDVFDNNWQIGHDGDANSGTRVFNGSIDEVALYLRTLSGDELARLATRGAEPVITSANSATFLAGLNNSINLSATGAPAPVFFVTGALPPSVHLSAAGELSGTPPDGSGGLYPVTILASNGVPPVAAQSFTLTVLERAALASRPTFNTNGLGWTEQNNGISGAGVISNNTLTLTVNAGWTASSAWFRYPVYVGDFRASYTYQDVNQGAADGVVFVLQNDPRGTTALGDFGSHLGFSDIDPSVGLCFNIWSGNGLGVSLNASGNHGPYTPTTPVVLGSGHPINVQITYLHGVFALSMLDTVNSNTYQTSYSADVPALVGANTAYVGFTGADGGAASVQTISNFQFIPLPTLNVATTPTNTVLLTWPASIAGYTLQSKSNLSDPNPAAWTAESAPIIQANGLNQAVLPAPAGPRFYRLVLP